LPLEGRRASVNRALRLNEVQSAQNTEIPRIFKAKSGVQACANPRIYLEFNAVRSGGNASRH